MGKRFAFYGLVGWIIEVLFTGASNAIIKKDSCATSQTYLWMHPIYGAAGLALEAVHTKLPRKQIGTRLAATVGVIYATEYLSGWILKRVLGKCPWDYTGKGVNVHGLVRLDYLPAWLLAAYLFEPVSHAAWNVANMKRPFRRARRMLAW
ncbi:MAG: putative ABC transporter permease [Myxococcaceae bacterium]